jgi:hypothetical protein
MLTVKSKNRNRISAPKRRSPATHRAPAVAGKRLKSAAVGDGLAARRLLVGLVTKVTEIEFASLKNR